MGTVESPNSVGCGTLSLMPQISKQNKLHRLTLVSRELSHVWHAVSDTQLVCVNECGSH